MYICQPASLHNTRVTWLQADPAVTIRQDNECYLPIYLLNACGRTDDACADHKIIVPLENTVQLHYYCCMTLGAKQQSWINLYAAPQGQGNIT